MSKGHTSTYKNEELKPMYSRYSLPKSNSLYKIIPVNTNKFPVDTSKIPSHVNKMLEILKLDSHMDVVSAVFKDVLEFPEELKNNFELFMGKTYCVLVPKNSDSEFMPMVCAHTDTVGNVHPKSFSYTDATEVYIRNAENKNMGADDRLGCFIISELIKDRPRDFIFALFDQEETGGIGSSDFVKSPEFAEICKKTSCFLGLDRRGDSDMASYGSESDEFLEVIRKIPEYKEAMGSFTDVATLGDSSNISCVNFSVGYYSEHTSSEKFSPTECLCTLDLFLEGLPQELWGTQYVFEDKPYGRYGNYYGDFYGYDYTPSKLKPLGVSECECCGKSKTPSELYESDWDGADFLLCADCYWDWYGQKPKERAIFGKQDMCTCDYCSIRDFSENMHIMDDGYTLCDACYKDDEFFTQSYEYKEPTKDINIVPYSSSTPFSSKGNSKNVVDIVAIFRLMDYMSVNTDMEEKEIRKYMRDVNLLSYFTKFETLKDDQAQKVKDICAYYGYIDII